MTRTLRFFFSFFFLLSGITMMQAGNSFVLVIDAGHGGHDAGAVGSFSKEKDINLRVALAFGQLVELNSPDVKVVYTRKTDVFVPLDTRADIANNHKADLFISIHTNSLPAGRIAYGSETYTLGMARAGANLDVAKRENSVITYETDYKTRYQGFDPNKAESYVIFEFMQDKYMKQSIDFAWCIQKQYVRANRKDKGVHQAGFLVLRKTGMPAVLTELGFISTPEEESYLNSEEGVKTLSTAIYNGFVEYRNLHGYSGKTLPPPIFSNYPTADDKTTTNKEEVKVVPVETKNKQVPTQPSQEKQEKQMSQKMVEPKVTEKQTDQSQQKENVQKRKEKAATAKDAQPTKKRKEENRSNLPKAKPSAKLADGPHYTIQFASSSKETPIKDPIFRGIQDVRCTKRGNVFVYTSGIFASYAEAEEAAKHLPSRYKDYLIVKEEGKGWTTQGQKKKEQSAASKKDRTEITKQANALIYRLQFATTPTRAALSDPRFKGVPDIRCFHEGRLYKYTSGNFSSYSEARTALKELQKKFPDAFIVKFQGGVRQ